MSPIEQAKGNSGKEPKKLHQVT